MEPTSRDNQGLTLIETLVATLVFVTVLLSLVPIFTGYQVRILRNEIQGEAMTLAQEILDTVRRQRVQDPSNPGNSLPKTGTFDQLPTGESLTDLERQGRQYQATITYCDLPADMPPDTQQNFCNDFTRHLKVQVFHDGQRVYEVETVYTDLQ
ncbi:hypothetical protein GS597_01885 [Synechococcales cyanobacterium C]|uniref:Type II secretion system protein n=1 Tax=Petrachloros mirabilis ULC683 TaxID=2781853 RepID=A0A8K2A6M8_9CYAN|nr:hypothetical protein [Petrachloros mirabilis]NCJ05285.1 hypothetical protein [Petrachloros mirabilis ULC683]